MLHAGMWDAVGYSYMLHGHTCNKQKQEAGSRMQGTGYYTTRRKLEVAEAEREKGEAMKKPKNLGVRSACMSVEHVCCMLLIMLCFVLVLMFIIIKFMFMWFVFVVCVCG